MTTFNFTEANGTTLEAVDSKWNGTTTTMEVQSGALQPTATPAMSTLRFCVYENSQPQQQKSAVKFKASSFAASPFKYALINATAGSTGTAGRGTGYSARIDPGGIYLYRNSFYVNEAPPLTDPSTTDTELTIEQLAGGVIKVYQDGVEVLSYTDGSPLTGGYPGFAMLVDPGVEGGISPTVGAIDSWTDGIDDEEPPETLFIPRRRVIVRKRRIAA